MLVAHLFISGLNRCIYEDQSSSPVLCGVCWTTKRELARSPSDRNSKVLGFRVTDPVRLCMDVNSPYEFGPLFLSFFLPSFLPSFLPCFLSFFLSVHPSVLALPCSPHSLIYNLNLYNLLTHCLTQNISVKTSLKLFVFARHCRLPILDHCSVKPGLYLTTGAPRSTTLLLASRSTPKPWLSLALGVKLQS